MRQILGKLFYSNNECLWNQLKKKAIIYDNFAEGFAFLVEGSEE
jgi:hypothetical protein